MECRLKWQDHLERYDSYLLCNTKCKSIRGREKYWECVEQMLNWINKEPIKITQNDLNKYNAYMWRVYSHNSLIPHTVSINHFFKMLQEEKIEKLKKEKKEVTIDNLFQILGTCIHLTVPPKKKVNTIPLTEKEMEKMIQSAKDNSMDYALLLTLKDTIQRANDVVNININDIDFEELVIRFEKVKGGEPHETPISKRTANAIRHYITTTRIKPIDGTNALFISLTGRKISRKLLWRYVKKYAVKAGINKRAYPHLFRHSGITLMDKQGVSPKVGMKISGHKDEGTYLGYIHPDRKQIRQEFDRTIGNNIDFQRTQYQNSQQPVYETPNENSTLSNEKRKMILLDALILGKISEDTYRYAIEQLKRNTLNSKNINYVK